MLRIAHLFRAMFEVYGNHGLNAMLDDHFNGSLAPGEEITDTVAFVKQITAIAYRTEQLMHRDDEGTERDAELCAFVHHVHKGEGHLDIRSFDLNGRSFSPDDPYCGSPFEFNLAPNEDIDDRTRNRLHWERATGVFLDVVVFDEELSREEVAFAIARALISGGMIPMLPPNRPD